MSLCITGLKDERGDTETHPSESVHIQIHVVRERVVEAMPQPLGFHGISKLLEDIELGRHVVRVTLAAGKGGRRIPEQETAAVLGRQHGLLHLLRRMRLLV